MGEYFMVRNVTVTTTMVMLRHCSHRDLAAVDFTAPFQTSPEIGCIECYTYGVQSWKELGSLQRSLQKGNLAAEGTVDCNNKLQNYENFDQFYVQFHKFIGNNQNIKCSLTDSKKMQLETHQQVAQKHWHQDQEDDPEKE